MSKQPDEKPEVLSITDVPESHTDEMHRRMVKYTLAMGIRLACLLLFFFIDSWFRWFFVAGAVFLPWIAVIIANGGSDKSNLKHSDALLDQAPQLELETGPYRPEDHDDDVITGELIDDEQNRAGADTGSSPDAAASGDAASGQAKHPAQPDDLGRPDTTHAAVAGGSETPGSDRRPLDQEQSAAFMGSLSPVTKRRGRKAAA